MRKLIFILFYATVHTAHAILPPPNNAVSLSLGGASATYTNAFAIENNVAALAKTNGELSLNASNRFGLSEYSQLMLAGNFKSKVASIGFAYRVTPFSALTEHKAQLGIAKELGEKVAAGVAINYHYFASPNAYYQNHSVLTFNAGIYYTVNDKLNAGFSLFNPNRSTLTSTPEEHLVANFRIGLDYALSDNLKLYSDLVQASEQQPDFNAGMELTKEHYHIRGGFGLNQLVAVGFGWQTQKLTLDVTAAYHNQLGFSPSLNVSHAF